MDGGRRSSYMDVLVRGPENSLWRESRSHRHRNASSWLPLLLIASSHPSDAASTFRRYPSAQFVNSIRAATKASCRGAFLSDSLSRSRAETVKNSRSCAQAVAWELHIYVRVRAMARDGKVTRRSSDG